MSYSNEKDLEMMLIYGECNHNNATAAVREYTARFLNRRQPDQHGFTDCYIDRNVRVGAEEQVLENMEADPWRSIHCVVQMSGCSRSTTHRILQDKRLHPYHYTRVQHL
ncbi:hypothetical protein Zmor_006859 [Zophobas morio]|uniref:DUF4817 domain-containing protein n=1 Tax=Zophobas morio TaxID=2755281 RepID=A0AA38MNP8_9CUCU|nr:hypothetical protein Zmor_006859 [Zophobas morio]